MSPELSVFFAAMTPFVELKLAIPLGAKLGLSAFTTIIYGSIGTMVPAIFGLAIADKASKFLREHSQVMNKFFKRLFDKTRHEHSKKFERYGALFLIMFVAIPLPGSGSATGALIAFIFGVDYWKAIALIMTGTIIAAGLLTAGIGSIQALWRILT